MLHVRQPHGEDNRSWVIQARPFGNALASWSFTPQYSDSQLQANHLKNSNSSLFDPHQAPAPVYDDSRAPRPYRIQEQCSGKAASSIFTPDNSISLKLSSTLREIPCSPSKDQPELSLHPVPSPATESAVPNRISSILHLSERSDPKSNEQKLRILKHCYALQELLATENTYLSSLELITNVSTFSFRPLPQMSTMNVLSYNP